MLYSLSENSVMNKLLLRENDLIENDIPEINLALQNDLKNKNHRNLTIDQIVELDEKFMKKI